MDLQDTQNTFQQPQIKPEKKNKLSAIKFLALVAILVIIFLLVRKPITEWLNLSNLPSTGEPSSQQSTPQSFTERITEITEGKKITYTPVIQVSGDIFYQKEQDDIWIDEKGDTITGDLIFQNANIDLDGNSIITSNTSISSEELEILDNGISVDEILGQIDLDNLNFKAWQDLTKNDYVTNDLLNYAYFDAYGDLFYSGRLNNDYGTDLLTRDQLDSRFVNEGQFESISSYMITNGTIINEDIASAAGILWSKISKSGSELSDIGDISTTSPASGEVLKWNGSRWAPATDNTGAGGDADTLDGLDSTAFLRSNANDTYTAGNTLVFNGSTDFNGDMTISDQTIVFDDGSFNAFDLTGNLHILTTGDNDDYIYFKTITNVARLYWAGTGAASDPGIYTNGTELGYIDETDSWVSFDSLGVSYWSDGGTYLYPTNDRDIQLLDGNWIGVGSGANQPYLTFDDSNDQFEFIGGYVGIGTTTPYAALDVLGDSIVRGDLVIKETSADTEGWTTTSTSSAPIARSDQTTVWTGSEMIVWGGWIGSGYTNTGGRYNPSTDTWTGTSGTGAPTARDSASAVWTGSKMIIWGGYNGSQMNSGGIYDPSTNSWSTISTTGAPTARYYHTAVWTGSKMIIWGGFDGSDYVNTGGIYDPQTDTWTSTTTTSAPTGRGIHTAIWTGSKMIVWGGRNLAGGHYNTGGLYDPIADSWTATTTTNAPSARRFHRAVWTGSKMIIWAGYNGSSELDTGGLYDPANDSWTATSTTSAPTARENPEAVWTGNRLLVWGGWDTSWTNTGGLYDPDTDTWTATTTTSAPTARRSHSQIWTGSKMIVWGGGTSGGVVNTGGIYTSGTETGGKIFIQNELTVDGNIFAAGTVTSGGYHSTSGADVAEDYITSDSSLYKGHIVSFQNNLRVTKSIKSYQPNILGVISTNPGLRLSDRYQTQLQSEERLVPVALSGRVPVKVSTINGSIKSGDPITSSNIPGVGMKATKPGFIIGRALDYYQNNDTNQIGKILLFINITWYEPEEYVDLVNNFLNDYNTELVAGSLDTVNPMDSSTVTHTLSAQNGEFSTISAENAHVTKDLQVGGLLSAYQIETELLSAKDQRDIVIKLTEQLGKTALIIQNSIGEAVFKVESTGKISIKDTGDNASVGTAEIPADRLKLRVNTMVVTENSKVFVTPRATEENVPSLGVLEIHNGYFVVKIESIQLKSVKFDWWVIN